MIGSTLRNRIYGDFLMPSALGDYRRLLESVLGRGYEIIPVERFWQLIVAGAVDRSRRYLVLRHDLDTDPRTAAEMWRIERQLGIESSYYFRLSTVDVALMSAIAAEGGEVGYHYEELATVAKARRIRDRDSVLQRLPEAQDLFRRNLARLRARTGLPMRVVSSHGDFVNRRIGIPNWAILVDERVRQQADVDLEVYDDAFIRHLSSRHTDSGYPLAWTGGDLVASLDAREPAVYVLVHPRNWHARRSDNLLDDARRLREGVEFRLRKPVSRGPVERGPISRSGPSSGTVTDRWAPIPGSAGRAAPAAIEVARPSGSPERPVLLVRAPASREVERRYVLDVVLGEWLGLDYRLVTGDDRVTTLSLQGDETGTVVELPDLLFATPEPDWLTVRSLPAPPLQRLGLDRSTVAALDSTGERLAAAPLLPVVYAEPGAGSDLFRRTSAGVRFAADILGSVFFMLTRYEEVARPFRDEHDRFPFYASLQATEAFVERPVVDEYVDALWVALHELWPGLDRASSTFRLRLTHDVDQPWAALGQPAAAVLRALAGDLAIRRDPALACRRARSLAVARAGRIDGDPYDTFDVLMATSERHGLRSTFYFMAGDADGPYAGRYRLTDPPVRRLLRNVSARGHEIGLHASYGSTDSSAVLAGEVANLRASCEAAGIRQPSYGVRQHYLRFDVPTTWRSQALAGLEHDSTLGFADHVGFRAGTCREFPAYDVVDGRRLDIRERPLLIMDVTLSRYQALDEDRTVRRALSIVDACRRHDGDAVVLFHNDWLRSSRLRSLYQDLVAELAQSG